MTINLALSPETQTLLDRVREWAVTEGRPFARQADTEHAVPAEASKILSNCPIDLSPLLSKDVASRDLAGDKEYAARGEDGSNVLGVSVVEQVVYGDMSLLLMLPGNGIGGRVVKILGTPEQADKWAGGLERGDYNYAGFALTEPEVGSDAAGVRSTAVRTDEGWLINGRKIFCSGGAMSDFVVVFASVDLSLRGRGIRAFIVEMGAPGFSVAKSNESKLGVRSMLTSELVFEDVLVPHENCLGPEGSSDGLRTALATLSTTRPQAAAMSLGVAQASLDCAHDLLKEGRSGFTSKRWEAVERELAGMDAALASGRDLIRRAAWRMDVGLPHEKDSSLAKAYAAPLAEKVCLRALQLLGAEGTSHSHLIEKWYRDIKIMDIWEGTGNIQRLVITRDLAKAGPART